MTLSFICLIIALICFGIRAFTKLVTTIDLIASGLFFSTLAAVIGAGTVYIH